MTTTPNKGYPQPVINGNVGTWGTLLNNGFLLVDANLGGFTAVSCTGGANVVVTGAQAQNLILQLTGAITANIQVQLPAQGGFWIIDNETTGTFTVTVVTQALASTGVVVPKLSQLLLYSDGTNIHSTGLQAVNGGTGIVATTTNGISTVSLAPISNNTLLANISGGALAPSATTLSALIDAVQGSSVGSLLYRAASGWSSVPAGVNGQVLQTTGSAGAPIWISLAILPTTGVINDLATTAFFAGDMLYYNGTNMVRLPAGAQGQVLTEGASNVPGWATISPSGIVPDFLLQNAGIR